MATRKPTPENTILKAPEALGSANRTDHDHDHSHDETQSGAQRRLLFAAIVTGLFMVAEVAGGLISGSLALLADAGHMMTDFAALMLAYAGFAISRLPASWRYTFGYQRFQTLSAFINGLTLIGVAIWIVFEAAQRLQNPSEVLAGTMLIVAIVGLGVNLLVLWILMGKGSTHHHHGHDDSAHENLNMRGAVLHVMGDLLGSVAAIAAALLIMKTGFMPIDPILSVFVALLILRSAVMLVKESAHVLLEGAPKGIDRRIVVPDLIETIPGLISIDHFHVWTLNADRPLVIMHGYVKRGVSLEEVNIQIKAHLAERYKIDHASVDLLYPMTAPIVPS